MRSLLVLFGLIIVMIVPPLYGVERDFDRLAPVIKAANDGRPIRFTDIHNKLTTCGEYSTGKISQLHFYKAMVDSDVWVETAPGQWRSSTPNDGLPPTASQLSECFDLPEGVGSIGVDLARAVAISTQAIR